MSAIQRRAKGSTTPVKFPIFDSPLNHGWVKLRVSEIDNCVIFGLDGIAEMKQSLEVGGLWIGNILVNGKWQSFESEQDLETLTAHIKEQTRGDMLDFIDGPIPFVSEDDQIFASGLNWDGDPEDTHEPCGIPFQGEPAYYPEGIF